MDGLDFSEGMDGLRPEDAFLFEDEERNEEQAGKNKGMRARLLARKKAKQLEAEKAEAEKTEEQKAEEAAAKAEVSEVFELGEVAVEETRAAPWMKDRDESMNRVLLLHEELVDYYDWMQPREDEKAFRESWLETIRAAVKREWPEADVLAFGSYFTGLYLPCGDIDLSLVNLPADENKVNALKRLSNNLIKDGVIADVEVIASARVPIAKLIDTKTGLLADLSVAKPGDDPQDTSHFIMKALNDYQHMKPLIYFLKFFLLQRDLSETFRGGIGSYLLTCLVLHFLQHHPSSRNSQLYKTTTLGHLLVDFFKYYGREFRYEQQGISVRDGGSIFRKDERGWFNNEKRWALCVESPLEPSIDIGGKAFQMRIIRNCFSHAYQCLCAYLLGKEKSALCPNLLSPEHFVLVKRDKLIGELPPALNADDVKRIEEGAEAVITQGNEPPNKKMRKAED